MPNGECQVPELSRTRYVLNGGPDLGKALRHANGPDGGAHFALPLNRRLCEDHCHEVLLGAQGVDGVS